MSVTPREPAASASPRERLNGWKDIANHLGKGVRTAQRWERDYGLPVHRLGRDGGEIVFAFSDELDTWLARSEKVRNESHAGANGEDADTPTAREEAPVPAAVQPATPTQLPASRAWILTLLSAAIGALALFLIIRNQGDQSPTKPRIFGGPPRNPAMIEFRDNTLAVLDEQRELLWTKRFSTPVADRVDPGTPSRYAHLADLEGDGSVEVVFKTPEPPGTSSAVDVFNADGSHRFTHRLDTTVRYGTNTHGPTWLATRTFLVRPPAGPLELWVSFIPPHEFPTRLDHLDARGKVLSSYWSNGYIEWVSMAGQASRDMVLIGATNNELRGASLAAFDRDAVRGSAPAENEAFRCLDCGEGGPELFLVFPRPCFLEASGGQPFVDRVTSHGDGRLTVLVRSLVGGSRPTSLPPATNVYYELGADFDLRTIEVGADFRSIHASYERDHLIDHPFGQQDLDRLSIVRRWDGNRFVTLPRVPIRVAGLEPDSRRSGRP